jgi:asparagine synthase (glutamine-hydrolysing)
MCGILASLRGSCFLADSHFRSSLDSLAHRGPDDHGIARFDVNSNQVLLGQRRLSIIDLSTGGHQPIFSDDRRYAMIFNGEIYNYRELREELRQHGYCFHSQSDTEVLLKAWTQWGEAVLPRLQGMFAFVIFDQLLQTLVCVRDAFGIKPLFYYQDTRGVAIGSEVKPLLMLSEAAPRLNVQRAYDYLTYGDYDSSSATFFDEIRHLPPGHSLSICCRTLTASKPERWWWPSLAESSGLSFAAASDQLRSLFLESISLHLRSDVPLAAALSGGLDSSAVVCSMRHLEPEMEIHTFTFVAPGEAIDETAWVETVIRHVNAIPHLVEVNPDELAADLDEMIVAQGEPFGSTSIYAQYRVFKAAREAGMIVTLDGQGADELLAGYSGYPHARLRTMVASGDLIGAARFFKRWSQWPGRSLSQVPQVMAQGLLPEPVASWLREQRGNKASPWLDHAWFARHGVNSRVQTGCPAQAADDLAGRHLMAALRQAQSISGLPALLRHADRNSMHWSLESRVPFLTTRLAEFLLSMPEHYLLSPQGETKHLFRAAMRGIVPDAILDRRDKVGFATPELRWLQQLQPVIPLWLSSATALPFLDAEAVVSHVQAVLAEQKPFTWQVWRLINFSRWFTLVQPHLP